MSEPIVGELIQAARVHELPFPAMCGMCRGDMPFNVVRDRMVVTCQRCGEVQWYEVNDGQATCHPGMPQATIQKRPT